MNQCFEVGPFKRTKVPIATEKSAQGECSFLHVWAHMSVSRQCALNKLDAKFGDKFPCRTVVNGVCVVNGVFPRQAATGG